MFIVIEGADGVGKSTAATQLQSRLPGAILTRHPGATPLGKMIRQIVSNPAAFGGDLDLVDYEIQTLMAVDLMSFIRRVLRPALEAGQTVIADRINIISGLIYGLSSNLSNAQLQCLMDVIRHCHPPRPDLVFILTADKDVVSSRMVKRGLGSDRFDNRPSDFHEALRNYYSPQFMMGDEFKSLVGDMCPSDRFRWISSDKKPGEVVDEIVGIISDYRERH